MAIKPLQIILPLGLTAAAIFYVRRGVGATKLEYYPENVDFSKVSFTNIKPDLILRVVNPARVGQSIESIFFNVYANDIQIGRIEITTPFKIPAQASIPLRIPIQIFPVKAATVLAQVIKNKGKLPGTSIKGTVNSAGIAVPITATLS
jgi:LEA14-like dessication related protein